jgi:glycosyltransferase involved in cell wall biosynthesis
VANTKAANSPERRGRSVRPASTPAAATEAPAPVGRARLAFLSTFDPAFGNAAQTARMMAGLDAAARLRGVGLDMLVLAEDRDARASADLPFVHRCWNRDGFETARALELIAREHVNILHVQFHGGCFQDTDLPGFLRACRHAGIRLFGTFHFEDAHAELAAEAAGLMDRAYVHQEEAARYFVAHGVPPDRLRMLPSSPMLNHDGRNPAKARLALGLPADIELVTSLGCFEPHEGILEIILALPAVVARHPAIQFAFMGGDRTDVAAQADYIQECRDAVTRLGLENNVTFQLGSLPEAEAGRYLAASDVVVLNYTAMGTDLPPVAAFVLAHGRPLVTTPTPAFVPLRGCTLQTSSDLNLAQAINRVLEEPELAARLETQASAFLEESFYLRMGELLLGEYGLLPGTAPPARYDPQELLEVVMDTP